MSATIARPVALSAPAISLAGVLVLLAFAFRAEAVAAVDTWDRSLAYTHCWLVLPVAAYLAWSRRHGLAGLRPAPSLLLALPAVGLAFAWLVAERLSIMEGRQLAAIGLVQVSVVALLGWRIGRVMAAPLAYLVFLVPFGAFLVPALQDVTAAIILLGLRVAGIPHYADGLVIQIPAGTFLVAEACAGLRFVVASLAFGALYAVTMFRTAGRRLIVLVLAIVVPVLANGLRALGIVLMGHWLGSAEAAATDHVVYGWGFFTLVILLLIVAGLPFRQDEAPRASPAATGAWRGAPSLVVVILLLLPVGLAMAGRQQMEGPQAGAVSPVVAALAAPAGCVAVAGGSLDCGGQPVSGRLLVFPVRAAWSAIVAAENAAAGRGDEDVTFGVTSANAVWRVRHGQGDAPMVAMATWLDGRTAGGGVRSRATHAWNGLRGVGGSPVLAIITLQPKPDQRDAATDRQSAELIRRVIAAQAAGMVENAIILSTQQLMVVTSSYTMTPASAAPVITR